MDPQLSAFIEHARGKGMDHATIRMLLLSAGWKERDIARALSAQALDLPVPMPPDIGGAREAFLHLLTAGALYTAVGHVLGLVFAYVNLKWPDPATAALQVDVDRGLIPQAMAAVLVSFPLFLGLSVFINREIAASPEKARGLVRRWVMYLTLFLAAGTLILDLIALVAGLLQGEVTARFLIKVLVAGLIAGAGFVYFLKTLAMSPEELKATPLHRRYAWTSSIAVAVILALGLVFMGSPAQERLRRFDAQRANDIRVISEEAFNVAAGPGWRSSDASLAPVGPLPVSLEELRAGARQRRPRILDPATGAPYEYAVTGAATFRVCATFATARDEPVDVAWNHPAGRHCFEFDARNPRR